MTDDVDAGDIVEAADRAFNVVEAVDEAWLYRLAAQAMLDAEATATQSVLHQPDGPMLFVQDPTEASAWLQSDAFVAVSR
jgi:hypothetical protein